MAGTKLIEHGIDFLAILHDVVAGCHLQRKQHTGMPVLLDVAVGTVVLAHHTGHIPHAHHLASGRVAEDDLTGYLLLAMTGSLDVDGHLLIVVADAAAHGGEPLRLQMAEQRLLPDAVGLHALPVDIESYLLLAVTIDPDIGHRGNATQTVAQMVGVVLQFTIAALRTLDGYEQCRGVAEVVVGH